MQKLYSMILSFIFIFHSTAFSYHSSFKDEEIFLNEFSLESHSHQDNFRNKKSFNKFKQKMMKGLKREIRKNKNLSKEQQDKRWKKKLAKRFKFVRKNLPRFYKNKNLQKQMSKKQISYLDLTNKFSPNEEKKVFSSMEENVLYYGSYLEFLRVQLKEIEKSEFKQVVKMKTSNKNYRKIAQFDGAFWAFFGVLLMIIVPIAVVLIIISLSVLLATGGLGTPLVISWIVVLAGAAVCGIGMLADLD